jgi:hypothetical protein
MDRQRLIDEVDEEWRLIDEAMGVVEGVDWGRIGEPTHHAELAGVSLFLAQCYNGVENILKRICAYEGESLPRGAAWHAELLSQFRGDGASQAGLPGLLDDSLFALLTGLRKFRHFLFHGYSIGLDAEQVKEVAKGASEALPAFRHRVTA